MACMGSDTQARKQSCDASAAASKERICTYTLADCAAAAAAAAATGAQYMHPTHCTALHVRTRMSETQRVT